MTLTFLGQAYETTIAEVPAIHSERVGCYRGAPLRFSNAQVVPRASIRLTYRGVAYTR